MKYIEGSLLDMAEQGNFNIIVQDCNCFCTMGSGLAKQIKDRYPKAYLVDQMTQKGDIHKLGKFTQAHIDMVPYFPGSRGLRFLKNSFTIINAYTYTGCGKGGADYANYDALYDVFKQIKLLYDMNPQAPCRIGIPKIGTGLAGLAGGDWDTIEGIIDDIGFSDLTCVIYKEQ